MPTRHPMVACPAWYLVPMALACGGTMPSATQVDTTPPHRPALTATPTAGYGIALAWTVDDVDVVSWRVTRDGAVSRTVTVATGVDGPFRPATSHCYTATARDGADNESEPSAVACATTLADTTAPTAPRGLGAAAVGFVRVALTWQAGLDDVAVTSQRLRRDGALLAELGLATSAEDPSVAPGETHCYTASALDGAGNESPPSDPACVTLPVDRPALGDVLQAAVGVAGHVESYRLLPDAVPVGARTLNAAQFLALATQALLDPDHLEWPAPLALPVDPYPTITLDDSYSRQVPEREEFLSFFGRVRDDLAVSGAFPDSWGVPGSATARVRFCEAVYHAAGFLRATAFLGEPPASWPRFLASPRGLVPWVTPAGYEDYTSPLGGWTRDAGYTWAGGQQYELFALARGIVGSETDPYLAGERIFDWVVDRKRNTFGYTYGTSFPGEIGSSWELANAMYFNSAIPARITSSLMRAVGIPSSMAGAAYFEGRGWVNAEYHAPYGGDPLANPYYGYDVPPPTFNATPPSAGDLLLARVAAVRATPATSPPDPGEVSVHLNAADVAEHGAAWLLDHAPAVDTFYLTVKSLPGHLYFAGSGWPERERSDALGPFVQEAHARGKRVFAVLETLADKQTGLEQPAWTVRLNESCPYLCFPNVTIDPCVAAYRDRLRGVVTALVTRYPIDGLVLTSLHYTTVNAIVDDTVGHPECPTGTGWMGPVLTAYAADLADAARTARPGLPVVVASEPFGQENRYPGLAVRAPGYQDLAALSAVADDILLVVSGSYWLLDWNAWTGPFPFWQAAIADHLALTGRAPLLSLSVGDEWEFDAGFLDGLVRLARWHGARGVSLHARLSAEGDFAPAFTERQWSVLAHVRLE